MSLNNHRIRNWLVFIIAALSIPLIVMQFTEELNWQFTDFMIMGIALSVIAIAYEFVAHKSRSTIYKSAFALGLVGAFLLFWVNGAVGIIGNENQDANMLYGSVFLVGALGSLISRFNAKGMSNTLYIASFITLLVPMIAIIIWPPSVISWSPGVPGVFLMSAFFAMIFFISGMLFRRSLLNALIE